MSDPKYKALRSAMLHATKAGTWQIGNPTSHPYIYASGRHALPLIYARVDKNGNGELQGYTELTYAVEAANAVPSLLQERAHVLESIIKLHDYINMAAAHKMGEPPLSYDELVKQVMTQLKEIANGIDPGVIEYN